MGIAADIERLGEDIVASYDLRIKAIGELVRDVHKMLKGFQAEHEEMSDALRADLEKGETDRLKEFKALKAEIEKYVDDVVKTTKRLMDEIQKRQKERNTEVADLLEAFKTERERMAANWQALTATMAKRREGKPVVSAGVEVETVEEAVKKPKKRGRKKKKK